MASSRCCSVFWRRTRSAAISSYTLCTASLANLLLAIHTLDRLILGEPPMDQFGLEILIPLERRDRNLVGVGDMLAVLSRHREVALLFGVGHWRRSLRHHLKNVIRYGESSIAGSQRAWERTDGHGIDRTDG
jgi:hypothetical protein